MFGKPVLISSTASMLKVAIRGRDASDGYDSNARYAPFDDERLQMFPSIRLHSKVLNIPSNVITFVRAFSP